MSRFCRISTYVILIALLLCPLSSFGQFYFLENEKIGKPVSDFTLNTVSGERLNLAKYRDGKKTIIFFWATWCPHCREALSNLNKTKDKIAQKGIKVALVDVGESLPVVQKYVTDHKVDLTVFLDEESKIAEEYNLIGVPTFFFINEKGIIKTVEHALPEDYEKLF